MKNTLIAFVVLLLSIHASAAQNSLVQTLLDHAQTGTKFTLTKASGNCDKVLTLKQAVVPQTQSQVNFTFGNIALRADSSQEFALMTETIDGVELTYRQNSGPEILTLSHYLPRVRNQLVKFYSVDKAITVEAIEYNYDAKPVYQYCVYYIQ